MSRTGVVPWESLERWSGNAFLIGGVMFSLSAAITVIDIAVGAEQLRLQLGQATVGAGWIAGLVGLLGLYPGLVSRNRNLVRAAVVFVGLGLVGYVIMTVGVLVIFAGVPEEALSPLQPVFVPLMAVGTALPFPLFGFACFVSDARSRNLAVLLVTPTLLFVANVLTPATAEVVLLVLVGLLLANFAIGYHLRTGRPQTGHGEREPSNVPPVE